MSLVMSPEHPQNMSPGDKSQVTRRLDCILDEFQCGMTSMFLCQGKNKVWQRKVSASQELQNVSLPHSPFAHTHTHTQEEKKKSEHTSRHFSKRPGGTESSQKPEKWIETDDIQTRTHARVENSTPKRPLNFTRLMTRKKKTNTKREETVFQHACMGKYCSGT